MQLSHSPTLRLATTPAKESYHLLGFTGFCKEHHLLLRGVGSGSHCHVHILVADVHIKAWRGRKRLCPGASPQAYWKDYEGTVSSRDGDNTRGYRKGQGSSQQQTLGKPCFQCYSGLKEAARYACNDAKIVNACARESFVLLACGFERLDRRARQDVALLGSEFLKLDARARQDTVKLDTDAQKNASRLQSIAAGLTGEAQIQLKTAAEKHWSDGALDADLRLADLRAKRRAMEDAYMALQLVKSIHNGMVKRAYQRKSDLEILATLHQESMLRGGDKPQQLNPGSSLMLERLAALQDAYWDIASALVEADGIDYSNPEELELIIATLLDMDAVDGANSATLLAECAKSPDVATRQALANALGNAPSLWALGNAGMGALQRLTQDVNPAVAAAALKALQELEKQWQMDSKDGLIFRADGSFLESLYPREDDDDQRTKD